jgi:sugar fermentation stimulation protein A
MRGTYTIIVECGFEGYLAFGRLGEARLRKGRYLYTGSALGRGATSLERRLERHGRRSKKRKWHIDYLTSKPDCGVAGVVYLVSRKRLECKVNRAISKELKLSPLLPKIGASDCNCEGHLLGPEFHLSKAALMRRLVSIYRRVGSPRMPVTVHSSD